MSFPNIPDIPSSIDITRDESLNLLLASVAFEELGLAHIINAEAEKIQYVLGTIEGQTPLATPPTVGDLLSVNRSVRQTIKNVIKKEMLLQFQLEDVLANACISSTFDFPSADSTVVGSMGFINADEVGYFWSVDRGDRVSQTFSASDCVNRARLEVEVVTNALNSGAFVAWELLINGVSVGTFTVEEGFIGEIALDFAFPNIQGPLYEVDLRVTNQVPGGEGSITLAYASDFAHSLSLACCEQSASTTAIKKTEHSPSRSQSMYSLELNNRSSR